MESFLLFIEIRSRLKLWLVYRKKVIFTKKIITIRLNQFKVLYNLRLSNTMKVRKNYLVMIGITKLFFLWFLLLSSVSLTVTMIWTIVGLCNLTDFLVEVQVSFNFLKRWQFIKRINKIILCWVHHHRYPI